MYDLSQPPPSGTLLAAFHRQLLDLPSAGPRPIPKCRNSPSKPAEANWGNDEQVAELLAEQIAEAEDSVT